jgi:hypothetical protein
MSATDDRIKQILEAKARELKIAEERKKQAEDQLKKHPDLQKSLKKWEEDTLTIRDILRDFQQKMADFLHLDFRDVGQQGTAIAVGRIFGRVSGRDLQLTLNVYPNGEIHVFREGPKAGSVGVTPIPFPVLTASRLPFTVLTANREQYESIILDAIEAT